MPSVPKFIGDFMELAFKSNFAKVSVKSITILSSQLKAITFQGNFKEINFKIGQAILIRIDDTNFRNYTPSYWDNANKQFEVIFHIHGNGIGSKYIDGLKENDTVTIGMARGFSLYKKEYKYHFLFGDESCISVYKSLKDIINANDKNYLGVLELDNISKDVPHKLGLMVDAVQKSENRAEHAISALNQLEGQIWNVWQQSCFYLMGNAKSIQNFRKALNNKGVSSSHIYTKPFWADGKLGL